MQILIDIPKETYQIICMVGSGAPFVIDNAIRNGIPLPKGHGRLVDGDALEEFGKERMYQIGLGAWNMFDVVINAAQTIIEADREVDE